MPRKIQFTKSKKSKGKTRSKSLKSIRKSRKYRGRGGCENGSCSSCSPTSALWTSKGGSDLISKDIYNHATDQTFYSSAN